MEEQQSKKAHRWRRLGTWFAAGSQRMTRRQTIVATAVSLVCGLVLLRHLRSPPARPDYTIVFLLALGTLPWMSEFFKRFGIRGLIEAEVHDKTEGETDRPSPPAVTPDETTTIASLSDDSRKILATLWFYQQALDDTYRKRWTFMVNPISPEFPTFLRGLSQLVNAGLVAVAPDNWQCMLTNAGIRLMQPSKELQEHANRYEFLK